MLWDGSDGRDDIIQNIRRVPRASICGCASCSGRWQVKSVREKRDSEGIASYNYISFMGSSSRERIKRQVDVERYTCRYERKKRTVILHAILLKLFAAHFHSLFLNEAPLDRFTVHGPRSTVHGPRFCVGSDTFCLLWTVRRGMQNLEFVRDGPTSSSRSGRGFVPEGPAFLYWRVRSLGGDDVYMVDTGRPVLCDPSAGGGSLLAFVLVLWEGTSTLCFLLARCPGELRTSPHFHPLAPRARISCNSLHCTIAIDDGILALFTCCIFRTIAINDFILLFVLSPLGTRA